VAQLLLISAKPEDRTFVETIAAATGLGLKIVATAEDGAEFISTQPVFAVFADTSTELQYQQLESAIQASIGLFSDKINANAFHFISSEELQRVHYLIKSQLFGHFIIRPKDPVEAGRHYARIVKSTQANRAFGLQNLLSDKAKVQIIKFQISTQKQNAVEAVKNYLLQAKFQSRMATVVANAVDELLMNAMFDAPVDDLGRPTLASTSRATAIKLDDKHTVELQIGYDGEFVGAMATDLFGSLDKNKLLSHISKIYTEEEYKVKTAVAGAGIGLATVFRSGGSFFFVSEVQVRTEVTVFFKRADSFREFKDQFRFISTQFYF